MNCDGKIVYSLSISGESPLVRGGYIQSQSLSCPLTKRNYLLFEHRVFCPTHGPAYGNDKISQAKELKQNWRYIAICAFIFLLLPFFWMGMKELIRLFGVFGFVFVLAGLFMVFVHYPVIALLIGSVIGLVSKARQNKLSMCYIGSGVTFFIIGLLNSVFVLGFAVELATAVAMVTTDLYFLISLYWYRRINDDINENTVGVSVQ